LTKVLREYGVRSLELGTKHLKKQVNPVIYVQRDDKLKLIFGCEKESENQINLFGKVRPVKS
jgi:hypothetical protein